METQINMVICVFLLDEIINDNEYFNGIGALCELLVEMSTDFGFENCFW